MLKRILHQLAPVLVVFLSSQSNAMEPNSSEVEASEVSIGQLDLTATWWNAGSVRKLTETPANPDNRYFQIPANLFTSDFRPEVKFVKNTFRLVARPRFIFYSSQSQVAGETKSWENTASGRWSEGYAQWNATDTLQITYGLQSYQWGPAESASPSNRIFHDTVQARDILYDIKGHHLFRANFTPAKNWSEVLLVEPGDNGDPEFEYGEAFAKKALLKSEVSWNNGSEYVGLILSWRDRAGIGWGEYTNLELFDGLTFYVDASHQRGSMAWYPEFDTATGLTTLEQDRRSENRIYTTAATGLRYAFENGNDLRAEWIYQEAGYSKAEEQLIWNITTAPANLFQVALLPSNLERLQKNGLEFSGRQFALVSLRIPDVFRKRDFTFYARVLTSLADSSGTLFNSWEYPASDAGVVFATISATSGTAEQELRGLIAGSATIGYKHTW